MAFWRKSATFTGMETAPLDSQDELTALRALVAEQAAKLESQEAEVIKRDSIIGLLRAQLELLRHRQHGASSEKIDRKIEQFELMLEEIEASRAEAELRSGKTPLPELEDASEKPKRKPLPDGLPTEELVYAATCNCPTCGGTSFLKSPDRVVQVLEHVPASVKIVRHVEKRMICRECDTTVAGEMPTLPIERGKPGPGLLAHIMIAKFDDHIPLYRLSEMYDRLGIDISRSVMADRVGRVSALLTPPISQHSTEYIRTIPRSMFSTPDGARQKPAGSGSTSSTAVAINPPLPQPSPITIALTARGRIQLTTWQASAASCMRRLWGLQKTLRQPDR